MVEGDGEGVGDEIGGDLHGFVGVEILGLEGESVGDIGNITAGVGRDDLASGVGLKIIKDILGKVEVGFDVIETLMPIVETEVPDEFLVVFVLGGAADILASVIEFGDNVGKAVFEGVNLGALQGFIDVADVNGVIVLAFGDFANFFGHTIAGDG